MTVSVCLPVSLSNYRLCKFSATLSARSTARRAGRALNMQVSTELTAPTAESVQPSKTLAEMQSLDEHDTAEVSIP